MTLLHKVALVVIAGGALLVGVWAQAFPRSFYDDFPGMGRVWVAVDGPFNEHLVRDVGGLNLGLAFVAIMALVTGSLLVTRAAGGAALLFGVPHLTYHLFHLDTLASAGDKAGIVVSLGGAAFAGILAVATPTAAVSGSSGPPAR